MDDFEMYATGWMNPDEQEQWDHVTQMMANAGEYDGMVIDHNADDMGDSDIDDGVPFHGEEIEF